MDRFQQSLRSFGRAFPNPRSHQRAGSGLCHKPQRHHLRRLRAGQHTDLRGLHFADQREPRPRRSAQQQGRAVHFLRYPRPRGQRWYAGLRAACAPGRKEIRRHCCRAWRAAPCHGRAGRQRRARHARRRQRTQRRHDRHAGGAKHPRRRVAGRRAGPSGKRPQPAWPRCLDRTSRRLRRSGGKQRSGPILDRQHCHGRQGSQTARRSGQHHFGQPQWTHRSPRQLRGGGQSQLRPLHRFDAAAVPLAVHRQCGNGLRQRDVYPARCERQKTSR